MKKGLILGLLFATVLAIGLRCPGLAERPMHNDEAVNAIKFGELWEHGQYKYDPNEHHGPTLYYATLAVARLTSSPDFEHLTEIKLRLISVLFSLGLIFFLPLLCNGLGKRALVWGAILTAVSPAMVFYSRYYIHEMLLVFFTFVALGAGWRYWQSRKVGWAILLGTSVGLMYATKETFIITLAAAALALGLNEIWNRLLDAAGRPERACILSSKHCLVAVAVCLFVASLLFSSFFSNPKGIIDSIRTYAPWLHRAEGESPHIHPWSFYIHRLLFFHLHDGPIWTEGLIFILGLIGMWVGFCHKGLTEGSASLVRFLALYTLFLTVAYCLIPYKTPWCLLNFWHGMILLAGVGASALLRLTKRPWAKIALSLLLLAGAMQLGGQARQAAVPFASDPKNPYVYAQTSSDILNLVERVKALARVHPQGRQMLVKVMAPEAEYWPLPWYLRGFKNVGWWAEVPQDPFAPVMIVSSKFHAELDEKKSHLMTGLFQLRPGEFFELYVEVELWKSYLEKTPADRRRQER